MEDGASALETLCRRLLGLLVLFYVDDTRLIERELSSWSQGGFQGAMHLLGWPWTRRTLPACPYMRSLDSEMSVTSEAMTWSLCKASLRPAVRGSATVRQSDRDAIQMDVIGRMWLANAREEPSPAKLLEEEIEVRLKERVLPQNWTAEKVWRGLRPGSRLRAISPVSELASSEEGARRTQSSLKLQERLQKQIGARHTPAPKSVRYPRV